MPPFNFRSFMRGCLMGTSILLVLCLLGAVAPDVLILVVMGACGRPARRGDLKRVLRSGGLG